MDHRHRAGGSYIVCAGVIEHLKAAKLSTTNAVIAASAIVQTSVKAVIARQLAAIINGMVAITNLRR